MIGPLCWPGWLFLALQARAKAWMRALALPSSGTARPGPNTFSRRAALIAAPAAAGGGSVLGCRPCPVSSFAMKPASSRARGCPGSSAVDADASNSASRLRRQYRHRGT